MTTRSDQSNYHGRGEFAQRDAQVLAEVNVVDGIIKNVQFSSTSSDIVNLTSEVVIFLSGKSVSKALEFTCEDLDECCNREKKSALSVMLEAFHRALEECLD